jgi:hypothetical protein
VWSHHLLADRPVCVMRLRSGGGSIGGGFTRCELVRDKTALRDTLIDSALGASRVDRGDGERD